MGRLAFDDGVQPIIRHVDSLRDDGQWAFDCVQQ